MMDETKETSPREKNRKVPSLSQHLVSPAKQLRKSKALPREKRRSEERIPTSPKIRTRDGKRTQSATAHLLRPKTGLKRNTTDPIGYRSREANAAQIDGKMALSSSETETQKRTGELENMKHRPTQTSCPDLASKSIAAASPRTSRKKSMQSELKRVVSNESAVSTKRATENGRRPQKAKSDAGVPSRPRESPSSEASPKSMRRGQKSCPDLLSKSIAAPSPRTSRKKSLQSQLKRAVSNESVSTNSATEKGRGPQKANSDDGVPSRPRERPSAPPIGAPSPRTSQKKSLQLKSSSKVLKRGQKSCSDLPSKSIAAPSPRTRRKKSLQSQVTRSEPSSEASSKVMKRTQKSCPDLPSKSIAAPSPRTSRKKSLQSRPKTAGANESISTESLNEKGRGPQKAKPDALVPTADSAEAKPRLSSEEASKEALPNPNSWPYFTSLLDEKPIITRKHLSKSREDPRKVESLLEGDISSKVIPGQEVIENEPSTFNDEEEKATTDKKISRNRKTDGLKKKVRSSPALQSSSLAAAGANLQSRRSQPTSSSGLKKKVQTTLAVSKRSQSQPDLPLFRPSILMQNRRRSSATLSTIDEDDWEAEFEKFWGVDNTKSTALPSFNPPSLNIASKTAKLSKTRVVSKKKLIKVSKQSLGRAQSALAVSKASSNIIQSKGLRKGKSLPEMRGLSSPEADLKTYFSLETSKEEDAQTPKKKMMTVDEWEEELERLQASEERNVFGKVMVEEKDLSAPIVHNCYHVQKSWITSNTNAQERIRVEMTIISGYDLVAKDQNVIGQSTTSDPYCEIFDSNDRFLGRTATIERTLDPVWNERFDMEFSKDQAVCVIKIWDCDIIGEPDAMGTVRISIPSMDTGGEEKTLAYPVPAHSANGAKGCLHIRFRVTPVRRLRRMTLVDENRAAEAVAAAEARRRLLQRKRFYRLLPAVLRPATEQKATKEQQEMSKWNTHRRKSFINEPLPSSVFAELDSLSDSEHDGSVERSRPPSSRTMFTKEASPLNRYLKGGSTKSIPSLNQNAGMGSSRSMATRKLNLLRSSRGPM